MSRFSKRNFESSKKRALLEALLQEEGLTSPSQKISPRKDTSSPPLSFAQARLWFLNQLEPNAAYNIPVALRLKSQLNVTALQQSLNEILRRHEALRTTFVAVEGQPVQVIASKQTLTLPVVDLQELQQAIHLATELAQQPFDLARDLLLRAKLLRLDTDEHVLVLVIHHIVFDGWSLGVFIQELATLYEAFAIALPSPLSELSIQYADFALWQRQWLQGEVLETQLAYWKQQLADLPVLQLPTDRPRPVVQTFRGAVEFLMLPKSLTEALKALSQGSGVSLFMTLLAAFKTLLYRYTGQDDIVVGSGIANRHRGGIDSLIGFFVNILVLRTDLSANPSFRELLDRVRKITLDAYDHQDLPFEKLVEELQPERELARMPLFQVVFVLQNAPMRSLELPGLTLSPLAIHTKTARFDIEVELVERPEGLYGSFEYNTDLFDAATIARMLGHFQTLLEGIVADPEQRLADLPLLTEAERQQLLVEWNDTQMDYPQNKCIHQLFEAQVEQTPDAVAVVFASQQLTYQELNARANQLAYYLHSLGVGVESLVGLCLEHSLEMVVGILGVLKVGGAYLPLEPRLPQERLAFMLQDAQVSVLLTQKHLVEQLPKSQAQVVCLDADWETITINSDRNPLSPVKPDNLAYVIYTSGSTGQPKGVEIQHSGLVNLVTWHQRAYSVTSADRATQLAGPAFDASVWELWPYLTAGASIHVPTRELCLSPLKLLEWLATEAITICFMPTPLFTTVVEQWPTGLALRFLLIGGDKLQRSPRKAFTFSLVNHYGPTENTVVTTCATVASATDTPPPIGRAIANTQVYLLDANLQPVPIGVPGELYISGVGLARGYLNRPELTAEKFIPNPLNNSKFKTLTGASPIPEMNSGDRRVQNSKFNRLYKTGDLARYLPNGNIEFLGRIDQQVKIRGFRIELGEIEAVLSQHPTVQETVVLAREYAPSDNRLVAYVVPNEGEIPTVMSAREVAVSPPVAAYPQLVPEWRRFVEERLPDYMVPSAFVVLEALPLTPNGKVDRRALPAPDRAGFDLQDAFVAPRDTLELQLTHIWEELLGVSPIGVTNNFFELGGHSLLAVRLIAQIQKQFGQNLPLATLFQGATIKRLAGILRQQIVSPSRSPLVAIQPGGSQRPFFCVHPAGGNVLCYYDLAHCLGSDRPFYGFQAQGLDGQQDPHTTVEDTAVDYIEALRVIQPEGPYLLGGWSYGGIVAFEMARKLQAQGQQVALLALIDSGFVVYEQPLEDDAAIFVGLFQDYHSLSFEYPRHLAADEQILYAIEQVKQANLLPSDFSLAQAHSFMQVHKANNRAARSYLPQDYPGRVTLFRAAEQLGETSEDLTLGLSDLAAEGVDLHIVPGKHLTILRKPNVQVVAEQLKRCLIQVQAGLCDE